MNTIDNFENRWAQLITKNDYKLDEIAALLQELNMYIAGFDYKNLDSNRRDDLQILLKQVMTKEQELKSLETPKPFLDANAKSVDDSKSQVMLVDHDSNIERIMNEAEELFYAGRYSESIIKYELVLAADNNWERAVEHRKQAITYLREGHIPTIALPPEAAILFGKAQSAARVGRYKHSLELILSAKKILIQYGISKWAEGQEFEVQLHTLIEAEEVATEGLKLFAEGRVDEAIDKLEMVFQATQSPKYKDLSDKYREFKDNFQRVSEFSTVPNTNTPQELFIVLTIFGELREEYGTTPAIQTLINRMEFLKPSLINLLRQEITRTLSDAETSQTIYSATDLVLKVKALVDKAGEFDLTKEINDLYIKDVMRKLAMLESNQADLERAEKFSTIKSSQGMAKKIIRELHQKYPNDPKILEIQERLGVKISQSYEANPPPDDIDTIIRKAKELFSQQKIDEAIELLDYQYKILGVSRLRDLSAEYKEVKRIVANLSDIIYSGNVTEIIEVSKTIISLRDKYGDLPIPEPLLAKLNYQLLIYLIDSKSEENDQNTTTSQDLVIQGLLGDQPTISFHEYYRVLHGMILKDPLNQRLQILLSWVKSEIDLNERQSRNRVERNKSIDSFRGQAKAWFLLSIVTAIAFLALAIYIILLSTQQEDVWVRVSSLFSILPVFISKLVYDQSLTANRRADEMYEKLMEEDARNVELDRLDEKDFRTIAFQEPPKHPKKKKNDSGKDTSHP